MNKREKARVLIGKAWKPLAGVVGLVAILVGAGGGCGDKVGPGRVDHRPGLPVGESAAVVEVTVRPLAPRIQVVGTAASEERIHLSARIQAVVNEVFVSAGAPVKKGQALITLDDREIVKQLAAAEAALHQSKTEYDRAKQLFETQATTEQALTAAESMYQSARAQVERVKVMLTYARIVSPIDGVVADRRIESGDLAHPGQVLLSVYDPLRMRLEAPVPVRLIEKIALNQELEATLERPARSYKAVVTEIVSEVDPLSRTQTVKARLVDAGGEVLPGTFGRLWVEDEAEDSIRIPVGAVYRVGQLELVQVLRDGRALRRLVKTGPRHGGEVEVLSGLKAGDRVLLDPVKEVER